MHFSVKQYRQHAVYCVLLVIKFLVFSDSDSGYNQLHTKNQKSACSVWFPFLTGQIVKNRLSGNPTTQVYLLGLAVDAE